MHIYNYLNSWRNAGVSENSDVMRALAEACEGLRASGLVAEASGIGNGFITRFGQEVLDRGLSFLGVVERLGRANLHPSIESVRTQCGSRAGGRGRGRLRQLHGGLS